MKILLDENFPDVLASEFVGHEVFHVIREGWAGTKNGKLIAIAEHNRFDLIVSYDTGLPFQNDLSGKRVALAIFKPQGQGVNATRKLLREVLLILPECQPGSICVFTNRPQRGR